MDSSSLQVKLAVVERSYSHATQEWLVEVRDSFDQLVDIVKLRKPPEHQEKDEQEIRWYLEKYVLSDPYQIRRAREAVALLDHYKNELVTTLRPAVRAAVLSHSTQVVRSIRLEIVGQNSTEQFQSLHWELLETADWEIGFDTKFIVTRRIVVSKPEVAAPVLDPQKDVHILFISARPDADKDVDYLLISRPLVGIADSPQMQSRCKIDFVRPGSWPSVKSYLQRHPPGHYSIVHFDVHGLIVKKGPYLKFTPSDPKLLFDVQTASTIAGQLQRAEVKTVILNACNSASVQATNHGNLAQMFVEAGVSTVIAMSYAVLAGSAQIFVGQFYESFLQQRLDADLAAYSARRAMETGPPRQGAFGLTRILKDDIVPVVYKGYSGSLSWNTGHSQMPESPTPVEHLTLNSEVFFGRDIDILKLEELLFWKHAIHLYGPAGSGKTTLARHLRHWWVKTHFVDNVYLVSARDFESFEINAIYRSLAALICGDQGLLIEHIDDDSARALVYQSSSVIFIDDCETTAGKIGLESFDLPVLDQEAASNIKSFLMEFCTVSQAKSTLVLLSRTDALKADHMIDPDGRITNTDIGYYELKNLKPGDVIQIVKSLETPDSPIRQLSEVGLTHLAELCKFHDNNVMLALLLAPCIRQSRSGSAYVEVLGQELETQLPAPLSESISEHLEVTSQDNVSIFSDFSMVMTKLKSDHPSIHRTILCFALVRNSCLNFPNLSGYILNLAGWKLLPGCIGATAFRLSQPLARRAAIRLGRHHQEVFEHSPSTRNALRDGMKILKVIGLVEEDITVKSRHYYKLHPMLPYLLRAEILRLKDSDQFRQLLEDSFLDYWHFRAAEWKDAGETTIPGLIVAEWPNLCSAIALCIRHTDFGKGSLEVVDALKHVLKQGGRTPEKIETSLKLLAETITRCLGVAASSSVNKFPPDLVPKAMDVVRLTLQLLGRATFGKLDEGGLRVLRQSTSLFEAVQKDYNELDAGSSCTGIALQLATLQNEDFTNDSHKRRLFDNVWNAEIAEDASDELALFFYNTQLHLPLLLMDQRQLRESLEVSREMIHDKAEAILNAMEEDNLDNSNLKLLWSLFKLKHWADVSDIPFDLNGAAEATNMIETAKQRGIPLDENDANVAMLLAIAHKHDRDRARSILLNALHWAHRRNDRRQQQALHRALFMFAMENNDLEHSTLHFDEMIQLNSALAGGSSSDLDNTISTSQDRIRLEAYGNLRIADLVIGQHALQYNSKPGNSTVGTAAAPTSAKESDKAFVLTRLSKSLKLALSHNFRDIQCAVHLGFGSYEAFLEARPNAAWSHFARAVSLGDENNLANKERYIFGCDLASGRFMSMLMIAWRVKPSSPTRDDISEHISQALNDGWPKTRVRLFLDLVLSGVWIDHSFFQIEPMNRYFEESQRILFDEEVDIGGFIFWRSTGDIAGNVGWEVDREALDTANDHALLIGSMRQTPQD